MKRSDAELALTAARLLAPLVADVAKWLNGDGPEPPVLSQLPEETRSEAALARAIQRKRKASQG